MTVKHIAIYATFSNPSEKEINKIKNKSISYQQVEGRQFYTIEFITDNPQTRNSLSSYWHIY